MQVPTRKSGKYTNLKSDPYITKDKFFELKNKLEKLKLRQPKVISEVKRLAADGDFSENAAYQIAKGQLRGLNEHILEIEEHLKQAQIIKQRISHAQVGLGSRVTVFVSGQKKTYLILGSSETNPNKGIISRNSPLGLALMGRKLGERVKVILANKETEFKIIRIE